MSQFVPDKSDPESHRGKVVVLTGGASGIGAACVEQLYKAGALVVFGDVTDAAGEELVSKLRNSDQSSAGGAVHFVKCDVTKYSDNYTLFRTAYDKYGKIDHAVAVAGVLEQGKWFDPDLTIDTVDDDPEAREIFNVNVLGPAFFARIAVVFLRESKGTGPLNKSITLLGSVGSFRDSPGLFLYQTSKNAVLGLMRSMRKIIYERDGIRVNCICPGMTESNMTKNIIGKFRERSLNTQTSADVADIILGVQIAQEINGKAFYIEGATAWEFEYGLYETMPQWLGEKPTKMMRQNAEFVNSGGLLQGSK